MTRLTAAEVAVVSQAEVKYNIIILMDNTIIETLNGGGEP